MWSVRSPLAVRKGGLRYLGKKEEGSMYKPTLVMTPCGPWEEGDDFGEGEM